ncbi:hypothetical protein [Francisella sp. 19X1-34]|uniref:hypothetical protein n=1 Tax=Francisella sp. 19X1-34 TaxID=3087177 RepID=UPI002E2F62B1|nr:hypothetical protein [Francisella sp. 19X1-34]MED7787555.1 hypothetical protein [Francisella sp. 19X1-34]
MKKRSSKAYDCNYHQCRVKMFSGICKYFSSYRHTLRMYERLLNISLSALGLYKVKGNEFSLNFADIKQVRGEYIYITVDSISKCLEKIGRKQYLKNYELRLPIEKGDK